MKFIIFLIFCSISLSYASENQWVSFNIENKTNKTLVITDGLLRYGKWHKTGCELCEITKIDQVIEPNSHGMINSCGRSFSPTGTEGEFSVFDGFKNSSDTKQILHVYFSVPFLLFNKNSLEISNLNDSSYTLDIFLKTGGRKIFESGNVDIQISKLM